MKVCTKCKRLLPLTSYHNSSKGLVAQCKECKSKQDKLYRDSNKERLSEQRKKYYIENKEVFADKAKLYRQKHKKELQDKRKKYEDKHKKEIAECQKKYREANKEKVAEYKKIWSIKNKERLKANKILYNQKNKEYTKNRIAKYKKNNKAVVNSNCMKRIANKINATPIWFDEFDELVINEAYELAQTREQDFGVKFQIDHIIPLQSKEVCGFHCGLNIQVITASQNASKSNHIVDKGCALWK